MVRIDVAVRQMRSEGSHWRRRGGEHMSLHARNVAWTTGATPEKLPKVVTRLIADRMVLAGHAERVLAELRAGTRP